MHTGWHTNLKLFKRARPPSNGKMYLRWEISQLESITIYGPDVLDGQRCGTTFLPAANHNVNPQESILDWSCWVVGTAG